MIVRELIAELSKLNPELPVIYTNIGAGWADGEILVSQVTEKEYPWNDCKTTVIHLDGEGF